MTTTAEDVERPLCRCHGVPMLKDGHWRGRQKWQCGVMERARQAVLYAQPEHAERKSVEMRDNWWHHGGKERARARYDKRKDDGLCVKCGQPTLSETQCWDCLNYGEEYRAVHI